MNKKKIILISILAIVIIGIVALISMLNNSQNKIVISKPINEKVSLENVFQKLGELEEPEISGDTENEQIQKEPLKENPEEEIDFAKYNVLEKKAIVKTNDQIVDEVWMIKLGSYDQQEEVCKILGNRVQKLKNAFANNPTQLANLENAVIKQEDGIIIMIISENVKTLEETIAKEMKK